LWTSSEIYKKARGTWTIIFEFVLAEKPGEKYTISKRLVGMPSAVQVSEQRDKFVSEVMSDPDKFTEGKTPRPCGVVTAAKTPTSPNSSKPSAPKRHKISPDEDTKGSAKRPPGRPRKKRKLDGRTREGKQMLATLKRARAARGNSVQNSIARGKARLKASAKARFFRKKEEVQEALANLKKGGLGGTACMPKEEAQKLTIKQRESLVETSLLLKAVYNSMLKGMQAAEDVGDFYTRNKTYTTDAEERVAELCNTSARTLSRYRKDFEAKGRVSASQKGKWERSSLKVPAL